VFWHGNFGFVPHTIEFSILLGPSHCNVKTSFHEGQSRMLMNGALSMYRMYCDNFSIAAFHLSYAGDDHPPETRPDDDDEFPTPESLRRANNRCGETVQTFDVDGIVEPRPLWRTKNQVFELADFEAWDDRACMVSVSVLHRMFHRLYCPQICIL
jgi:hypothetical protein